jgi:hypothetical protein
LEKHDRRRAVIRGTAYGAVRADRYFIQTNNSTEFIVRAAKADLARRLINVGVAPSIVNEAGAWGYLESCGGNSIANACSCMIKDPWKPVTPGGWEIPADDIVMACMNNPGNADLMKAALPGFDGLLTFENRFMPLHPVAARLIFGIRAEYHIAGTFDRIRDQILFGNSVGIHLKGHYVAGVLFDDERDCILINDSWPGRKPEWKGDGFNRTLYRDEFAQGHREIVVYIKP